MPATSVAIGLRNINWMKWMTRFLHEPETIRPASNWMMHLIDVLEVDVIWMIEWMTKDDRMDD